MRQYPWICSCLSGPKWPCSFHRSIYKTTCLVSFNRALTWEKEVKKLNSTLFLEIGYSLFQIFSTNGSKHSVLLESQT